MDTHEMEGTSKSSNAEDLHLNHKVLSVNATTKGYHECLFDATVHEPGDEHFNISRKRGDRGNALRVHRKEGS